MKDEGSILGFFTDFNTDTVSQAMIKCLQKGEWHHKQMIDVENTIDHKMSPLNFLPCKPDNKYLKATLKTEIMKELDDFHDKVKERRKPKTKSLFIKGEQDTKEAVIALCANLLTFAAVIITNPGKL